MGFALSLEQRVWPLKIKRLKKKMQQKTPHPKKNK